MSEITWPAAGCTKHEQSSPPGTGQQVIQAFTDYDGLVHPVGETWTFIGTGFLPYEDGLTLQVQPDRVAGAVTYRLQWRPEEQAALIEHFSRFVAPC